MTRNVDGLMMQAVVAELKDKADAVQKAFGGGSLDLVVLRDVVASSVVQLTEEGVLFLVIFLNTLSAEDGLLSFEQMEQGLAYWSTVHAVMPIAAPQQVRSAEDLTRAEKAHLSYERAKTSGAGVENCLGWSNKTELAVYPRRTASQQRLGGWFLPPYFRASGRAVYNLQPYSLRSYLPPESGPTLASCALFARSTDPTKRNAQVARAASRLSDAAAGRRRVGIKPE